MKGDTDGYTELEILAATLVGEDDTSELTMTEVACVILNRRAANKHWLGGTDVRDICLFPYQFSCWNDTPGNKDRQRIISILRNDPHNPTFVLALRIAGDAIAGRLVDCVNNAVSYINHVECAPGWARGKTPIYINEPNWFYNLQQIEA